MTEVYLALGSNVGNPRQHIQRSIELLKEQLSELQTAPIYHSRAIGYSDQPDFLNTAIRGKTNLSAGKLLEFIKQVETKVGRTASFRWGPREIDIDIIFYGQETIKHKNLVIPHPEYDKRDFVLQPLLDLNPDLTDPVSKEALRDLLINAPKSITATVDQNS